MYKRIHKNESLAALPRANCEGQYSNETCMPKKALFEDLWKKRNFQPAMGRCGRQCPKYS